MPLTPSWGCSCSKRTTWYHHTIIWVFCPFVCVFVCSGSPPAFMDWLAPNLTGRLGAGTERTLRYWFPWQLICCHANQKMWLLMPVQDFSGAQHWLWRYEMMSHITVDIKGDITIAVASWRHHGKPVMVSWCLGASALFWATWWLEALSLCQCEQVRVRLGTPLAVI